MTNTTFIKNIDGLSSLSNNYRYSDKNIIGSWLKYQLGLVHLTFLNFQTIHRFYRHFNLINRMRRFL